MTKDIGAVCNAPRRKRGKAAALLATSCAALGMATPALAAGGTTTGADLQISGSASTNSPLTTATFTVTFQVKNAGPDTATSSVLSDIIQPGLVFDSATLNGVAVSCPGTTDSSGD